MNKTFETMIENANLYSLNIKLSPFLIFFLTFFSLTIKTMFKISVSMKGIIIRNMITKVSRIFNTRPSPVHVTLLDVSFPELFLGVSTRLSNKFGLFKIDNIRKAVKTTEVIATLFLLKVRYCKG